MASFFDEEENDRLQPAAEGQPEGDYGDLEDDMELPPLDSMGDVEYAPQPQQTAQDRRQALLALAKKTQAAGGEEGGKKKKGKKDKQRDKQQEARGSARPKRSRQPAAAEQGGSKRARPSGPELPEDEYVETEQDKLFIDDAGVPEDERYVEEDLEALMAAGEALEDEGGLFEDDAEPTNIVDEVIRARKRKKKVSDEQIELDVKSLISRMQACAKADSSIVEQGEKKPAMHKFQALNAVNEMLRQRSHHESFIQNDGLTAMALWLRPYNNGALPLLQIRTTLIDLLQLMALDTADDYIKDKLGASELGKILMFYHKNPSEKNVALLTKCRDLIAAWSAPIFADTDAELRKRRAREREHRLRMVNERQTRDERERREQIQSERRRKAQQGEEGFRARAAVPQPSRLDFVINPGSRIDPLDAGGPMGKVQAGGKAGAKDKSAMPAHLQKALAAKKRGSKNRFGGMSVEGRGLMV